MRCARTVLPGALFLLLLPTSPVCNDGPSITGRLEAILDGAGERGGGREASPDDLREALEHQLRTAPVPAEGNARKADTPLPTRRALVDFYSRRGERLAWVNESGAVLPRADTLLKALKRAEAHGLEPADYAIATLDRMRQELRAARGSRAGEALRFDLDLLLTASFFRYASDVSTGRVHPDEVRSDWMSEPSELNLPMAFDKALAEGRFEDLLKSLPPPHSGYRRLQGALADLRKAEAAGGWLAIPAGPALKRGSSGQRVGLLRKRLGLRGAGRSAAGGKEAGAAFDAALENAVKEFQSRHGIEPDGIAGKETLAALNVPVDGRIRQVELNLERWRWMPRRFGELHLEVNVPGFELALVRNGKAELRSRIVAGSAFTPTPVFTDKVVAVVANPPWNVPRELAVREYLPELKYDPKLFLRRGIRIFKDEKKDGAAEKKEPGQEEEEIDPTRVEWDGIDRDAFPYRLRQDPGPENALGRMKFALTNDFQIYLHDTPARAAFEETSRDLSHGCIRVEQARALADRLLGEAAPRLEEALRTEDEQAIPVRPPVPVQILYLTAWVDEEGRLRFGPDVYEFDAPQQEARDRMARADPKARVTGRRLARL